MPSRTCWLSLASRNCVAEVITASTAALTLNDESGEAPACTACLTIEINETITLIALKLHVLRATVDSRATPAIIALASDQASQGYWGAD